MIDPAKVALRLNVGQRSTILGLGVEPCVLGCSEPTAIRLSRPASYRPALTRRVDATPFPKFALTEAGVAVKVELRAS